MRKSHKYDIINNNVSPRLTMKEYYTYAYLREDRTPYYIGKGRNNRLHEYHTKFVKLPPRDRRIVLKRFDNEDAAYKHEIYMIAVFGRKDLQSGILINRTPGGDNPPKNDIAGWNKGKKMNYGPERGKKISEALKGKPKSKEHCAALSKAATGRVSPNKGKSRFIDEQDRITQRREYNRLRSAAIRAGTWKPRQ